MYFLNLLPKAMSKLHINTDQYGTHTCKCKVKNCMLEDDFGVRVNLPDAKASYDAICVEV